MSTPSKIRVPPVSEPCEPRWNIESIVAELRSVRERSLEARQRVGSPPRLPSRRALITVVDGLSSAIFPNRLGQSDLTDESIDYFVGHTLDTALRELYRQALRELQFSHGGTASEIRRASQITHAFALELPQIRRVLDTDLRAAFEGDPAARSLDEVLVCYPGINAIIHHRIAHTLHGLGTPLLARMIAEIAHSATGIDIHPGARIDDGFFIDHGTGVVIGETAVVGRRVRIYQAVTLGAKRFPADEQGNLIKGNARHPIVEDDVVIYAGATILGRITIGRGSTIGGNVWLTRSVPPGSTISQAQVRNEVYTDGAGI